MGNRATVIFTDGKNKFSPAVYLHWNGGPESVYGFIEELDRRHVRADQDYECARFIQIVGEHFDQGSLSGCSLGVTNGPRNVLGAIELTLASVKTDHSDNGFYLVNRTGNGPRMRRFTEKGDFNQGYKLVEMPENLVEMEKRAADKHEYRPKFRELYAKITEGKKIEGY